VTSAKRKITEGPKKTFEIKSEEVFYHCRKEERMDLSSGSAWGGKGGKKRERGRNAIFGVIVAL